MFITEKQSKLDSARIKLLLMEYFRYKKQFFGVVSEYQHCNEIEDFVAFKKYEIAVVEIKISKSDFLADFKKPKHVPAKVGNHSLVANVVYQTSFAIPNFNGVLYFYGIAPDNRLWAHEWSYDLSIFIKKFTPMLPSNKTR